ncbi:MAG TPA: hypothetical protein PLN03_11145 [Spirochaetota bacterium]|nr:hypothetical protein [Spirochaetota bacterium]
MIVNLFTKKNSEFKKFFESKGIHSQEIDANINIDTIPSSIEKRKSNFSLIEIDAQTNSEVEALKKKINFLYNESKVIAICEKITPTIRTILFETGIIDCIENFDKEKILSYIQFLQTKPLRKNGSFLILDDKISHQRILTGLIKRFGYSVDFILDTESLFTKIAESNPKMLLINIGSSNLDLHSFIKKTYSNSDFRKQPSIIYKDMSNGLFIHEIISGLNRITRVIYSPEEVYCLLIDMLFKKEIMTLASSLYSSLDFQKFSDYSKSSISQIFYKIYGQNFDNECIFAPERIDSLIKINEDLTASLIKVDAIKWLRLTQVSIEKIISSMDEKN